MSMWQWQEDKKCCERKEAVTVEDLLTDEMENILQTFYDIHPRATRCTGVRGICKYMEIFIE